MSTQTCNQMSSQPQRKPILVAEDDPDIRDSIAEALALEGFEVETAGSGSEALSKLLAGLRPAVVLLDLMMAGTSGIWFCEEQKKHSELTSIPVVIISADRHVELKGHSLEVQGTLKKPIGLEELFAAVNRFAIAG